MPAYLAFDLGASNGRAILGQFDGEHLTLDAVHRFDNLPLALHGHLYWDMLGLYNSLLVGLEKGRRATNGELSGIGVDTWGCDFALLDRQGKLVGNPYCYRDPQTEGIFEPAFERMLREEIFRYTGLQFMELNSLFQLLAMKLRSDPVLEIAATFQHIGDLMHYWLTGVIACEYSNASTSQILDAVKRDWSREIISAMGFNQDWFPAVIMPGSVLGELSTEARQACGLGSVPVIATATHDTAAAIVAVPAEQDDFAYLSSGTWGLLGVEIDQPLMTAECMAMNITNEGGAFGKITLLRNIANLWMVQECRRQWALEGEQFTWEILTAMAEKAQPFVAFIDPDQRQFLLPGNMPARIQAACQASQQAVPQTRGEVLRVILESLAFKYRYTLDRLRSLQAKPVQVLHIIGGGSRNQLLNQLSAQAMGLPVLAGPGEATALGNILVQMVATGALSGLSEARMLVRRNFPPKLFLPDPAEQNLWEAAYQRFLQATDLLESAVFDK